MANKKCKGRQLPHFEVCGSEQFRIFQEFFSNTMVLPVKVSEFVYHDGEHDNTIVFDVIDDTDRCQALGSLSKLREVFSVSYKNIIIRTYGAS